MCINIMLISTLMLSLSNKTEHNKPISNPFGFLFIMSVDRKLSSPDIAPAHVIWKYASYSISNKAKAIPLSAFTEAFGGVLRLGDVVSGILSYVGWR